MNTRRRQIKKIFSKWYRYLPDISLDCMGTLRLTSKWVPRNSMTFEEYKNIVYGLEHKHRFLGMYIVELSDGLSIEV